MYAKRGLEVANIFSHRIKQTLDDAGLEFPLDILRSNYLHGLCLFRAWYVETIRALALHQRLAILREADELRMWSSLDHQRVCTFCKKTFTGHEVQIRCLANNKYEVRCPTEGCTSSPEQWEYPGIPPYSDRVDADWWRPSKRTSGSVAEEVKNGKIRISQKGGRDGKLQTVRHEPVSASLLAEFLKEHWKVEFLEKAMAEQQKENAAMRVILREQAAQIQKVSVQLELRNAPPSGGE